MRYAIIKDGLVLDLAIADSPPLDLLIVYPDSEFIECDDFVERGWRYDGQFINPNPNPTPPPPPEPPTLEQLRTQRAREVQEFVIQQSELAVSKYGPIERNYWADKERSAKEYLATSNSDVLTIELVIEAQKRGITHDEISHIVLSNAGQLRLLLGRLISFRWHMDVDVLPKLEYVELDKLVITEEWGKWLSQD